MTAYISWLGRSLLTMLLPDGPEGRHGTSDLVLGAASGYSVTQILPYATSLREHYSGPAAMVLHDTDRALADFLLDLDFAIIVPDRDLGMRPPFGTEMHVSRYGFFARYLAGLPAIPRRVLICDTRDVLFQGGPFPSAPAEMNYYVEDAKLSDHATRRWLADAFGPEMATAIGHQSCICSGTMLGTGAAVQQLCRIIVVLAGIPRRGIARSFGIDQAAVNLAAHAALSPGAIHENLGHIATIGLMEAGLFHVDEAGRILNPDGTASAIVHQYDRHSHLRRAVEQRYGVAAPAASHKPVAALFDRVRKGISRRLPELR